MTLDAWGRLKSGGELPPKRPAPQTRAQYDLPNTLGASAVTQDGVQQQSIFDPALVHYPNAYRAADPRFADRKTAAAWRRARRNALDAVLEAVEISDWADSLVLRGSALLSAWFRGRAREPGDLDFVVDAAGWTMSDKRTERMFGDLTERPAAAGLRFRSELAAMDEIWTYHRVPGRRLVLPFDADGLPGGSVQLDFVFGEQLPQPAVDTELPFLGPRAGAHRIRVVTPELSLVGKLCWLITDRHPQGKDLYDAVLLAESHPLDRDLLRTELERFDGNYWIGRELTAEVLVDMASDRHFWDHFRFEYPDLAGPLPEMLARLSAVLFPESDGPVGS